jgi:hypothetical protein
LPYNLQTVDKSNQNQKQYNVQIERKFSGHFEQKNIEVGKKEIPLDKVRREKRHSQQSNAMSLEEDKQNDGNNNQLQPANH